MNFANPNVGLRRATPIEGCSDAAKNFARAARMLALARMHGTMPEHLAEKMREPRAVVDYLTQKADVGAASTSGFSALVGSNALAGGFQVFMRGASIVDTVYADAVKADLRTTGSMLTAGASAAEVAEGGPKQLQVFSLTQINMTPTKAVAAIAITDELMREAATAIPQMQTELRNAVRDAGDAGFLADITAANQGESLGLDDYDSVRGDIRELIRSVNWGEGSKLLLVASAQQATHMSLLAYDKGHSDMTPMGGRFFGLPVMVTDNLPSGYLSLIDSTGLVMALTDIELRASSQADMQLSNASTQSSVTPTQTNLTSAFQTGATFVIAERSFSVMLGRPLAVATLTGATWGSVDSPQ
jgi:hypothetical protein